MATFRRDGELIGIGMSPSFGIGQRALLVRTPYGNVLWDCISLIDDAIVDIVNALGGLTAIAISHPHYYTTMVEWSAAFGGIPVYLHAADRRWIMVPRRACNYGRSRRRKSFRASFSFEWAVILTAARCCTGRTAPTTRAPCSRAICCK
jgi:glyoxylase-like metal-dependent hydrolase (beta-lactamase superfamily II)